MNQLSFARGGKIIVDKKDKQKFSRIGIEDKYDIEAIKDIGLQGLQFTNEAILKKIDEEFKNLLSTYEEYVISEDSDAITRTIESTIKTMKLEGKPQSDIDVYTNALTIDRDRKRYIDEFASNQKISLSKWVSYLEQSDYLISFKYLLLKAVLKFNYNYKLDKLIERNNKTIRNFTHFDASIIGQLVSDNSDYLLKDYTNLQVKNSLSIANSKETIKKSGDGRWIKFDGGSNLDEKIIEKNANELSQLVQNTYWCTKTNAYSQLQDGDFYVYVTEKDNELFPRIAVRMEDDKVGEVRGNKSEAQDIEEDMLPIAEDFLINNIPNDSGKEWLDSIDYNKRVIDFSQRIEQEGLRKGDLKIFIQLLKEENIFNKDYGGENSNVYFLKGVFKQAIEQEDFSNDFEYPNRDYFDLYGGNPDNNHLYKVSFVNKNDYTDKIYPNLEVVLGYVGVRKDQAETGTGNLKYIYGGLTIYYSNFELKSLGNIEYVGGYCDIDMHVEDLGNLEEIGGMFKIRDNFKLKSFGKLRKVRKLHIEEETDIKDLGEIEYVDNLTIESPNIKTLGNKIVKIGSKLDLSDSKIEDLGSLEVCGNLYLNYNKTLKSLGKLKKVDTLDLANSNVRSLGNVEQISDRIYLNEHIPDFGKIQEIDSIEFNDSKIKSLGNIKKIKNSLDLRDTMIEDLGDLEETKGNLVLNSKIKSLGKLKRVGGRLDIPEDSKIQSLDNLEYVGRYLDISAKSIKTLGNLKEVRGSIYLEESNIEDLGSLVDVEDNLNLRSCKKLKTLGKLNKVGGKLDLYECKNLESLGDLEDCGVISGLSYCKKITTLGKLKKVYDLDLYGASVTSLEGVKYIKSLSIDTPIDLSTIPIIQELTINPFTDRQKKNFKNISLNKIITLNLYNLSLESLYVNEVSDLILANTQIKTLSNAKGLKLLEFQNDSVIANFDNVNLKEMTQFKTRFYEDKILQRRVTAIVKKAKEEYINQGEILYQNIEKYNMLINNLKPLLSQPDISIEDKKEIREAIDVFEDLKSEALKDIENRFEYGGQLFDNGGNMKKVDSGGITYGASHDNGGIPVKNASTGEMLEVEGGEGIVNKRSMASDKIVKLNGKEMTICEAVSQLNQIEGGVKFSCDDVEHRQFIEEMENGGELERGERTEMEHIKVLNDLYARRLTPKEATTQIAKDHIKENPNYYTELRRIEKMANGGKSSCGCSHHTAKFNYGGTTGCGCNTKKYDNGGELSDTDRMIQRLLELRKPKDEKQDLIDTTLLEARKMLDMDYKEKLQNLPPEVFSLIKNIPSFNLYNLGWRCHYTTHKTMAGVCVNDDYDENQISLKKHHIYLSIDFVRNEKNWSSRYKDVILHEIAHGIVTAFFIEPIGFGNFIQIDPLHAKTQGHGVIWKMVCGVLNPEGNCDQFFKDAIFEEQHKNYVYKCVNCGNKKYGNSPTFAKICNKCFKSIFVEKNNE